MNKIKNILAVDPGSRYLGVAALENNQLVYYGVRRIKTNQLAGERIKEAERIIQKLIDYYQPQVLAIEKPLYHWSKQSKLLDKICVVIKETAKENKVRVREFTPEQIRKSVCGNSNATREETAEKLFSKFPESGMFSDKNKIKDRYWHHIFDAVSLAERIYK
ncbi:MAG: crossover junction endodeoxyribonuclease RuvC [bacterium]|nr:crossover junction endodeoxyribonuclease RuvC [bacterium]